MLPFPMFPTPTPMHPFPMFPTPTVTIMTEEPRLSGNDYAG
jgi:hypothetical protein